MNNAAQSYVSGHHLQMGQSGLSVTTRITLATFANTCNSRRHRSHCFPSERRVQPPLFSTYTKTLEFAADKWANHAGIATVHTHDTIAFSPRRRHGRHHSSEGV